MRARISFAAAFLLAACVGDVELPPKPPTLQSVPTQTSIAVVTLRGTRPPNTAVLLGDTVVVESGEDTAFSFPVSLNPGENAFELWSRRPSGIKSTRPTSVTITYEPACPDAPTLSAAPPTRTNQRMHTLTGTKPAGTAVALDGVVVVPTDDATTFSWTITLPQAEGTYSFSFTTRDAKGHDSEPLRVALTYDVSRPALAGRYPTSATDAVVANTSIPTNSSVFVLFDEPIRSAAAMLPADVVTVSVGGTPVPGTVALQGAANALVWTPNAPLAPNVVHTVLVNESAVSDLAGNTPMGGATWTWSFTTGAGPSSTPPTAPTAMAPASSPAPDVMVSGTRDQWSSIYINGELVLGPGSSAWSVAVPLPIIGANTLDVSARTATNQVTAGPTLTVTRTVMRPAAPAVDASVETTVSTPTLVLTGTKPAGTSVLINGALVVCLNADTTWASVVTLSPGINNLTLITRNAQGDSDPVVFTVNYAQAYSGKVPSGWVLKVGFTLKDQTGTRLVNEFVTGNNNYGVDVWLEGPIALGETCEWDAAKKQRKNIKYVGTLEHYLGVKTGHTVPFADDDYRGADYLAALAAGGMLSLRGITSDTPRRDANGREDPALMGGVTEGQLRQYIDCFGLPGIDGCSEPTVNTTFHQVDAFEPRTPPSATPVDQGDYLLWVQFNLDRSGTWLIANDTETCWDKPSDLERGMHRVVKHVSLGATAWSATYTAADELSGPDPDGTGNARFLGNEGLVISWGPP